MSKQQPFDDETKDSGTEGLDLPDVSKTAEHEGSSGTMPFGPLGEKDTIHFPPGQASPTPGSAGSSFTTPPPDSFAGYKILKEIHRGGQGVVYQALQKSTKRKVAIKVMKEGPFAGTADKARFDREVQVLGQLKHSNIVAIHETGVAAGCHFFVMDYISGQPLDVYMQSGKRSVDETAALFAKICEAVNAAHVRGIIHRDLKPGNIRIDEHGEPHILDFGLAKTVTPDDSSLMTLTGQFIGSLPWASPEQAEGQPSKIDVRTDVYSLGVLFHQMLTGKFPYEVVGNMRDVLDRIMNAAPARPSTIRKQINGEIETIVLKCLQKDSERRYQSAGDLARDLEHYLAGEPIEARRDSALYLFRVHTTGFVRKHPLVPCAAILVFAIFLAYRVGVPLVYHWTPLNQVFEQYAYQVIPASPNARPFENIRVVALMDKTDLEQIAAQTGIELDCLTQDPCFRQAHGHLMKNLAAAGPAVVVWDITFDAESAYDEEFVSGVEALHEAGSEVVVAAESWVLTPEGLPKLSTRIVTATRRWGCAAAIFASDTVWQFPMTLRRGRRDPLPSLAVATLAAYHHPEARSDLRLDEKKARLAVMYWRPSEHDPHAKVLLDDYDDIHLGLVRSEPWNLPDLGIRPKDLTGCSLVNLPAESVLQAATDEYGAVLAADPDQLRESLAGKIVLIGNKRHGLDLHAAPAGRQVWGTYGHATAIDMLLRDVVVITPRSPWQDLGFTAPAALLGLLVGWFLASKSLIRAAALGTGCVLFVALGFLGAWRLSYLYNPLIPVLAMLVASELSVLTHSICRPRRT
ncbi:MAG: protein kinase [Phycisphaerae bacterium]|nr:protein kinase [Phycisphaerae bacterium]